jgi:hypothetical protein
MVEYPSTLDLLQQATHNFHLQHHLVAVADNPSSIPYFHSVLPTLLRQLGRHFQLLRTGAHHPFHSPRHISLEMLSSSCRRVQDLNLKP